jgi:hypothetical protein
MEAMKWLSQEERNALQWLLNVVFWNMLRGCAVFGAVVLLVKLLEK